MTLWQAYRSGGFGAGHLPYAGGVAEQPAWLWAAFRAMDAAAEKLRPKAGEE